LKTVFDVSVNGQYSTGTIRNVLPLPPPSAISLLDIDKNIVLPLLLPMISSVSLSDTSNAVQQLIQQQAVEPQIENLSLNHTPKSDHKTAIEIELELLETKLRTVQLALEILTGTCATLPDPEPDLPANQEDEDVEGIYSFVTRSPIFMFWCFPISQNLKSMPRMIWIPNMKSRRLKVQVYLS